MVGFRENLIFGTFPACSAVAAAATDVDGRCAARVSTDMASKMRARPIHHGMSIRPSGLFPSVLRGSFGTGILVQTRLLQLSSLRFACLAALPGPSEQDSPWEPLALTKVPHRHAWGTKMFTLSLRPTATLDR